ncbi:MAG: DinB family protein [Algicola sp.]|nr:DinB family protein [Algicola sp.]
MIAQALIKLFTRDLTALQTEIESYANDSTLWLVTEDISNSAGNLCLHLVGNLNHFIGAALGNSGYVRQRDLEFSLKDVPKAELIEQVEATKNAVVSVLEQLSEEDLQKEYIHRVFKEPMTTAYFLMHLSTHLAYHLGQINYHRRLLDR